jgi:[protein-PII] uridylyltransferase
VSYGSEPEKLVGTRSNPRLEALLRDASSRGSAFSRAYGALIDEWLAELLPDQDGVALVAVGGYGRRELCPGSDLDLLLLHQGRRDVAALAEQVWYPIWDAGLQVDHSVRTVREAVTEADRDLKVAMGLLDARVVHGDTTLGDTLITKVRDAWRSRAARRLPALDEATIERHDEAGAVAFLLEPDLKEGHGGLRDLTALGALAVSTDVVDVDDALAVGRETLLEIRVALQRITGRRSNVLGLEQQDDVAAALGDADADALMTRVAQAGRIIMWHSDDAWHRVRSGLAGPRRRSSPGRDVELGYGIVLRDGEVILAEERLAGAEPTLLHVGAAAAHTGAPIARATQRLLADHAPTLRDRWAPETRDAFVALLGAGPQGTVVLETLDRFDLITRVVPEWETVRSRPQRNAFHQFTVDRHLMEAAAQAAALTRRVERPDLLLVGAFFHDLGKGSSGDHTDAGVVLMGAIAARMGYEPDDVAVLVQLVRQHLLLPKVATSRDLADPATLQTVADEVGSIATLELLHALTEADSRATGPTAWSPWRVELIQELVDGVRATFADQAAAPTAPPPIDVPPGPAPEAPTVEVRDGTVRVVGPDRPGLFAASVGLLSLHGQDVRAARAASSADVAVAEFDVEALFGKPVPGDELERELTEALEGRIDLDGRLAERARAYGRFRLPGAARPADPLVLVHPDESPVAAIVEVRAPDGIGVLYRIARALVADGLDIRLAKIATLGHEVVDTFYVVDARDGGRPALQSLSSIEANVVEALRDT